MSEAPAPRALIAEDEPLLARTLSRLLGEAWPGLQLLGVATDGLQAIELGLAHTPELLFLDIQMPGRSGLEVAEALADDWPDDRPQPLFVFVTAHDGFALQAFERAAVDYLLKPATPERLALCVQRLQQRLAERCAAAAPALDARAALMQQVQSLAPASAPESDAERIKILRAGVGNTVRMIPVSEVICFEATEKYVNVVTAHGEALVRMSLRELMARIEDARDFQQIHRSVVVNTRCILSATRDEIGHYSLSLRGLERPVKVSRAFGYLFRPM
ncbi:LytR/AlgR family response regulator transcription factor [Inhella sp.]|uniref:LytR/AlgR family response regulator transcription factor n=1 Tax=Inhella sp. TaxID=1921806 RepID=UPI0035AEC0A8